MTRVRVLHGTNECRKCIVWLEMTTCKPTMHFPSTMQTLIWMPVLHTAGWAQPYELYYLQIDIELNIN
jgi:hypothetical protein